MIFSILNKTKFILDILLYFLYSDMTGKKSKQYVKNNDNSIKDRLAYVP